MYRYIVRVLQLAPLGRSGWQPPTYPSFSCTLNAPNAEERKEEKLRKSKGAEAGAEAPAEGGLDSARAAKKAKRAARRAAKDEQS